MEDSDGHYIFIPNSVFLIFLEEQNHCLALKIYVHVSCAYYILQKYVQVHISTYMQFLDVLILIYSVPWHVLKKILPCLILHEFLNNLKFHVPIKFEKLLSLKKKKKKKYIKTNNFFTHKFSIHYLFNFPCVSIISASSVNVAFFPTRKNLLVLHIENYTKVLINEVQHINGVRISCFHTFCSQSKLISETSGNVDAAWERELLVYQSISSWTYDQFDDKLFLVLIYVDRCLHALFYLL